ncbi:radical SAM protein [Lacinutrix jangbogonensis]|uniref:radical SAM protein n=1 Tax=Lacinutrix jangbogonensis TaxID=1469557 RepID=UPI00053E2521|nr:radical SAM protein [Lacinutrix jangbogonensis]
MSVPTLKKINKKLLPKNYMFTPEWIVLGVNNICNLYCKMCDVATKNLDSNFAQNLVGTHSINTPLVLIKKFIDQTTLYYPKAKLGFAFAEPLVYPYLIESVKYAKQKELKVAITTNALTLKQKSSDLAALNIHDLHVSLDGPQDIHNEIRGHKKSFQKAIEGIQLINEKNPKIKITIITAITEWNIGHLQELLTALKKVSIKEVGFMHTQFITTKSTQLHDLTPWGIAYPAASNSNMDLIHLENIDTTKLCNEIASTKEKDYPFNIFFSTNISSINELDVYYKEPEKIIGKQCNSVHRSIMVKSDGSVIPAHGRCYNLELESLYKDNLKQVWNGQILKN